MYGNVAEWTSTTVGGRNYRGGSYKLTSTYSLKTKNQQSWTSPDGQPGNNYNVGVFGFRLALVPVAE